MITKAICSSVVALAVAGVLSGPAPAQAQYNQYQPQYAPYPQQQYAPAQPQYQQQYQPQYAPAQPQYQPQYAPAQQQYAPQQYAPQASYSQLPDYCSVNNAAAGAATGAGAGAGLGLSGLFWARAAEPSARAAAAAITIVHFMNFSL
jgi:hypothetical protein